MGRILGLLAIIACLEACHEDVPKGRNNSSLSQEDKAVYSALAKDGLVDTIITKQGDTLLNINKERLQIIVEKRSIEPLEGGGSGIIMPKDGKRPKKMCVGSGNTIKTDSISK